MKNLIPYKGKLLNVVKSLKFALFFKSSKNWQNIKNQTISE